MSDELLKEILCEIKGLKCEIKGLKETQEETNSRLGTLEQAQQETNSRLNILEQEYISFKVDYMQFKTEVFFRFDNLQRQVDLIANQVVALLNLEGQMKIAFDILDRHEEGIEKLKKRIV